MDAMVNCETCNKEIEEWKLSKDGECPTCREADKAGEMTVGDIFLFIQDL